MPSLVQPLKVWLEGRSDGSGIISECGADYQRCTGAIYDFTLGSMTALGKELFLAAIPSYYGFFLFFSQGAGKNCFLEKAMLLALILAQSVICVSFQTIAFCS